jgi:F420-non-reducing hydrogenase iron-sulfur subunit
MESEFKPRIVGFLCNWCAYAGADLAGTSRLQYAPNVLPVRVMCSSRVDQTLLLVAYLDGADGVLVAGCHPGDCHYQTGNYYARRRFAVTKKVFEELGLETNRLRLSWISAAEGARYAQVMKEFTREIAAAGPNPTRTAAFL